MNSILNRYYDLAKHKYFLLVTAIVYLTSQIIIMNTLKPLGEPLVLELQTTFSPARFLEIINQWQTSDLLQHYYAHFPVDNIHPIWYGLFLSSLLAFTFNRDDFNPKFRGLILLPFLAGFCDFIENMSHTIFLADLNQVHTVLFQVSAVACWIKWVIFIGSFVFVIYRFAVYLTAKNRLA